MRVPLSIVVVLIAVALVSCGPDGPTLSADPSGSTLFEEGQRKLAEEDWRDAAEAFDTLLKNYPASPFLAEARLGHGKANLEMGRADTLIIAIDAFQSFLTYHPSHPRVDYAQYMIGIAYMEQIRSPDRDQSDTRLAVEAFDTFLASYPNSPLVDEVRAQRQMALDRLADHQLRIARWQLDAGMYEAAGGRCKDALTEFSDTSLRCDLTYVLAESLRRGDQPAQAVEYYQQIVATFPDCQFAADAAQRLTELGAGGR